jgi:hypothetical protein
LVRREGIDGIDSVAGDESQNTMPVDEYFITLEGNGFIVDT